MQQSDFELLTASNGAPINMWTHGVPVEPEAQLLSTAKMPFIFKHLAVMPDVHLGKGSKDIEAVMAAQSSLVEIVHTLRQVVCVKG